MRGGDGSNVRVEVTIQVNRLGWAEIGKFDLIFLGQKITIWRG